MKLATIGLAMILLSTTAVLADPQPKPLVDSKPVKVTSADAAGPVFSSKTAVEESGQDGPGTNVLLHRSKDHKVTMGLYEAAGASGSAVIGAKGRSDSACHRPPSLH
jgi:hypothetical protein